MAQKIGITGELESKTTEGKLADTSQIMDATRDNMSQTEINNQLENKANTAITELLFDFQNDNVNLDVLHNDSELDRTITLPCASAAGAGFMSAKDKLAVEDVKHNINSVKGDNAEELKLVDQSGKTLIRVNNNGVSIDEDEVLLNRRGLFPKQINDEADSAITVETENGKPIVSVTETGVEISKVISKIYNCSILPSCYINKTGDIISNGTMNVYALNTSGLSVINIDLLAPSTNGLPAFVGKKDEQVVAYKNHTELDRQVYTVDVTSFDTLYINVSKSGGTKVFISNEELLNYERPISGKVGLFLGDSLMQGVGAMVGYDAVSYVEKQLGCNCYNGGVGGTTMYNDNRGVNLYKVVNALITGEWSDVDAFISTLMSNHTGPLWQELGSRFEDIKALQARDISFIFINYGANDWKAGVTLDNEGDKEDVTTVCGSLRHAIHHILEWNPAIQIFVSTPGYRTDEIVTPEINGVSMGELCNKIQSACEDFHIPCWNQYISNGVNQYNADLYLSDGTHRTATGYALLGQQYTNFINNYLNNISL